MKISTVSLSETVAVISRVLPFEACLFGIHPVLLGAFQNVGWLDENATNLNIRAAPSKE
jgi:hypothetical protein